MRYGKKKLEESDFVVQPSFKIDCFLCYISFEVMVDPVITPSGHSYERAAIEAWLEGQAVDPITMAPLNKEQLIPNIGLRQAIEVWKSLDQQWQQHANQHKLVQEENRLQNLKISELEVEKIAQEKEILENKKEIQKLKVQYSISTNRFHSIHRRDIEGTKTYDNIFLQSFKKYFPQEAIHIELALKEKNPSQLIEIIAILQISWNASTQENEKLCAIGATLGYVYENLGRLTLNPQYYRQAVSEYKKIELLSTENDFIVELYIRNGWSLYRTQMHTTDMSKRARIGILKKAVSLFDKALEKNKERYDAIADKGTALKALYIVTRERNYEEQAFNTYSLLINTEKMDIAYIERGKIYFNRGDYKNAFAEMEEGVRISPTAFNYKELANRYKKYAQRGRQQTEKEEKSIYFEKAIFNYSKSLEQYREDENIHCNLGFCLENLDPSHWSAAMQCYKVALTINPKDELTLKSISRLEGKMQKKGEYFSSSVSVSSGSSAQSSSSTFWRENGQTSQSLGSTTGHVEEPPKVLNLS